METSLLLAKSILELFLYVAIGFVMVKSGLFTYKDSKILSLYVIYVATPCMIIHAFQVDYTSETFHGLLLALGASLAVNLLYILITFPIRKVIPLNHIEQSTLIYSNAGNFVIPLVVSILGKEWVLFCCGYVIVSIAFLWTHAVVLISDENKLSIKKILLNANLVSIYIGILLFLFQFKLPSMVDNVCSTLGSQMGPVAMIVIGMSFADMDIKRLISQKKAFLVCILRLTLYPVCAILLFKLTGLYRILPNAYQILFIITLQGSAPAAGMVTQLAQLYDKDAAYAASLNILTVALCIFTMPLIIYLYQIVISL